MEPTLCTGCRQRDALIADLQARLAQVEAGKARQDELIRRMQTTLARLQQRLEQYEPEVKHEKPGAADGQAAAAAYSVAAEEKRRRRKRRKKSPGRQPTELKFAEADRVENVHPPDVPPSACRLVRERAVWRLEDGRAVRVGYRVFCGPDGVEACIPGVTPRCEYGIEILVVLAFLVYVIGISLDKACAVLTFFCQLPLAKSQADALLRQLAQHWQGEFDILCDLIARAAVVYMDETGWKIGRDGCSLWTFASELQRVFLFGCHKDAATL
jgi:transposase